MAHKAGVGHISPVKDYWKIWGYLMGLMVITIAVAFFDIGTWFKLPWLNITIALLVAFTKMTLVILYFMHVKWNSTLTKIFVVIGFFFLLIMFGITMLDYTTRGWEPAKGWAP